MTYSPLLYILILSYIIVFLNKQVLKILINKYVGNLLALYEKDGILKLFYLYWEVKSVYNKNILIRRTIWAYVGLCM